MDESSGFTGAPLTFSLTSPDVDIAPAIGTLSVDPDALRDGLEVIVTAANSGGQSTASFRLTAATTLKPPVLLEPPTLAGSGTIGKTVKLVPGVWEGNPAPALAFSWYRDGVLIVGANGPTYTPRPVDDRSALTAQVIATNPAGSTTAKSKPLAVIYPAPVVVGELPDEIFDEDTGLQEIPTAFAFGGKTLSFSVEGTEATIDPATGVVSIDTAVPLSGETITVIAANSGGTARASLLVTVEVGDPALDFVIDAEQWTAVPDPVRGTGHRTITVDAGVTVPAGHQLKIWTWSSSGTATAQTATITPGVPYQSATALSAGATCYNTLWLYGESDGVVTLASEDEKTFLIDAPVVPPVVGTIDVVVSTATAAKSQIQSWIASGLTGPKTLGVNASTSGTWDLAGLVSPVHQITIRPLGTFSATDPLSPTCTVKHTGGITLTGSRNIRFYLYHLDSVPNGGVKADATTDVGFERCHIRGAISSGMTVPLYLMDFANTTRFTVKNCLITHALDAMIYVHGTGPMYDPRYEGNCFEMAGHDDMKIAHVCHNLRFINNWFGRGKLGPSAGPHDDCVQTQGGGWEGALIRGNVQWRTSALWSGGVGGTQQGFWSGDPNQNVHLRNAVFEQNISITDNQGIKFGWTGDRDAIVRYNMLYTVEQNPGLASWNYLVGKSGSDVYKNYIACTAAGGSENDGLWRNTVSPTAISYVNSDPDFVNGGPRNSPTSYVDKLLPKTSSRLHWAHSNPVGPHTRIREIVDHVYRATLADPVIPADVGWPVASFWSKRFNANGGVVTRYTGKFDANGNNT